jgi:hypothetical protein
MSIRQLGERDTHKWQPAVLAGADHRLVCVDEDPRMSQWTTAAVTGDSPLLGPSHGLFMDQLDGSIWLWLKHAMSVPGCQKSKEIQVD